MLKIQSKFGPREGFVFNLCDDMPVIWEDDWVTCHSAILLPLILESSFTVGSNEMMWKHTKRMWFVEYYNFIL